MATVKCGEEQLLFHTILGVPTTHRCIRPKGHGGWHAGETLHTWPVKCNDKHSATTDCWCFLAPGHPGLHECHCGWGWGK